MPSLLTPISALSGIGPALSKKFAALELETLEDALFYFPIRHEDWRTRIEIAKVQAGMDGTIQGELTALRTRKLWRGGARSITEGRIDDGTAVMPIIWFNQPYLQKTLHLGNHYYVSGRIDRRGEQFQMTNPAFEGVSADPNHQRLVPIYSSVEGLSQRQIRQVIKTAIEFVNLVPDHLPAEMAARLSLQPRAESLRAIHFPSSPDEAHAAVRRLQFDELLVWQLRWLDEIERFRTIGATPYPFSETAIRGFVQQLPFELTPDQRQAAWEIFQELGQPIPMSRLLHGDVGSGKTAVAALAAYNVARQGGQVALLVPTVVLAEQHFRTLSSLFTKTDLTIGLLSGDQARMSNQDSSVSRRELLSRLRSDEVPILIGTHAMLESPPPWSQLGLVVVDEQQRFGVAQRELLIEQCRRQNRPAPHYLSLTATPIPRTLALFLSGELSLSRLRHKPRGRPEVQTSVITDGRATLDPIIETAVANGEQVFYITPLIVESDHFGAHAATTEFNRLRETHGRRRVGMIHGAMPTSDRIAVMDEFRRGEIDILVATTVIEVGIDIPNATVMIIDGADRFGLSQLHQLRGRIGRGQRPGHCYLLSERHDPAVIERLQRVAQTTDGLELAEFDLQQRGAGELYGTRQSGLPDWRIARLDDPELMAMARSIAQELRSQGLERAILMDDEWRAPVGTRHRE